VDWLCFVGSADGQLAYACYQELSYLPSNEVEAVWCSIRLSIGSNCRLEDKQDRGCL